MASTGHRARLPRFLPPDPRVEEPHLFTPKTALRVAVLMGLALAVFAVLFLRLWSLEILSGTKYRAQATNNQRRTYYDEALRGVILDRNGHVLVKNVSGTAVDLTVSDMPKGTGRDTELRQLSRVLSIPLSKLKARIRARRFDPLTPVTLKVAVHDDQVAYIRERQSDFPGVDTRLTSLRYYNSQALAAQLLGFVGPVSEQEYAQLRRQGKLCGQQHAPVKCYTAQHRIGQAGVEARYDAFLRGEPSTVIKTVDSRGAEKSKQPGRLAVPGLSIRLTLDIGLQRAAERALRYGIRLAHEDHHWAANGGAIVALDPRDGDVLAMASYPTFKPSVYVGKLDPEKLAPLLNQKVAAEKNYPGLNRTIQGVYPPGSTFKPVTAIAAMQEHLISPYQTLQCTSSFAVHGETGAGQVFKNWNPDIDEPMTLPVALAQSCDTYFYQLGYWFYGLPPDRGHPLQAWAARFGLGGPTGVDLGPESDGLLPTPEWRQQHYSDPIDKLWKPGDSIQLAIGQKDIEVTPLQMARLYALIANGGKLVTPHVAADAETNGQVCQGCRFDPSPPQDAGVDPAALAVVRDGLYQATHESYGTSVGVFGSFPIPIAGKTGTAEKVVQLPGYPAGHLEDQSWWCGFGPYDAPTIVVCALIENGGHGGTAAAPAALQVFEHYFHVNAPQQGTVPSD